ncbi:nucleotidyltransferase family protein [Hydrogenophaga sp.]|uniref:nucleotidyltransferase family protein n=1 Tax=Hydrogenophaga sp. TaxID=1904254 RepID=UPI00271E6A8B|nr:nucleotidyltransferase domain-containing protein [Hydrogenophaga sp.]MDO9434661.1 nucleotidyltransferase domain-containing protein [Hydrogenophaga sp.]
MNNEVRGLRRSTETLSRRAHWRFDLCVLKARRSTDPMHALIETHREQLLWLARRRGITSVRVFGSMARDQADDDSHVDLLVTLAPGTSALALGEC